MVNIILYSRNFMCLLKSWPTLGSDKFFCYHSFFFPLRMGPSKKAEESWIILSCIYSRWSSINNEYCSFNINTYYNLIF